MQRTEAPYDPGHPVQVYFNLHRRCWSVRQRGRVIGHATTMSLINVEWRVQPSGRERVRREGRKNVHAYASGCIHPVFTFDGFEEVVRYNPYKLETFVVGPYETPLHSSTFAHFTVNEIGRSPRTYVRGVNL